ncbi:hypothetical protein DTO027B5_7755 [Paecilomyces variotii]|nr:hypothetical protein DTO169C6_8678 [Paecilomyces variotii]KAJ9306070.1 hypothetical protein DTO217A2_4370 [Paecilomyces variotii]KAJ9321141.1 hypothetical protein DTO027B3_7897 [Paecilomyces variotii]KAJ9330449.1 hypothetical protein DTO027B5_7755 [Paecilomyces variotii]KAJ9394133.1 hypothetical protein DTO282F9_8942 [Paecilomyces variotii]
MSKSRTPLYLGLGLAGAGGYYLYRAGGDPQRAKNEVKHDAERARSRIPTGPEAEKIGEKVGSEAGASIDEAVNNAKDLARSNGDNIRQYANEGIDKIDQIRHDTAKKLGTSVDKLDRTVENKASEAKSTLSSWFGGSSK